MTAFERALAIVEEDARARLLELCTAGATVYCVLRGVSRSGASRRIDLFVWRDRPLAISYEASILLGMRESREGGIYVEGAGQDMGWHLVDKLSRELGVKLKSAWI